MIASFMIYAVVVSALASFAGWAMEAVIASRVWPRRGVWAVALALSLIFPAVRVMLPHRESALLNIIELQPAANPSDVTTVAPEPAPIALPNLAGPTLRQAPGRSSQLPLSVGSGLLLLWIGMSTALLVLYVVLWMRLRLSQRHWRRENVKGLEVWVTDELGPAVFGCLRPRILIPQWIFDSSDASRSMV